MNKVKLSGILKNIQYSHTIQNTEFDSAQLIVKDEKGQEDTVNLKFKSHSRKNEENDLVCLEGNLRSYSYHVNEDKNRVQIYVFTYFDAPDIIEGTNEVEIDGRICKINPPRETKGKIKNIHFILANNIVSEGSPRRLNSYIPCIAWGEVADKIATLSVNSKIKIKGSIHSREHKAHDENGELSLRLVHELVVKDVEVLD